MSDYTTLIQEDAARLKAWLFDDALPLWLANGIDRRSGGFFERLDQSGRPLSEPRRSRVQPRQIYCFTEAGRLGWTGAWQGVVSDGLENFFHRFCNEDGTVISLGSPDGGVLDASFNLYNQAFALFAYAQVGAVLPDRHAEMRDRAVSLLTHMTSNYAHPARGFEESRSRALPLRSNPHMHLFEAFLAWEAVDKEGPWSSMADDIADLCLERFIDPETGGLREFFDEKWAPMPGETGRLVEPGHQFEWAWLLVRWSVSRQRNDALRKARRLFDINREFAVDEKRGVAVMGLLDDFSVHDPVARLWPQTEWIKAAIILAEQADPANRSQYQAQIHQAVVALEQFLEVPVAGLWRDKLTAEGIFVEEPAPASTFYHIVCALSELFRYGAGLRSSD